MKKPNIIAFRRENSGIDYHRIVAPLEALNRDEDVTCNFVNDPRDLEDVTWNESTHLVASRMVAVPLNQLVKFKKACEYHGKKLIIDVDDWWHLPHTHPKRKHYDEFQIPQRVEECLRIADVVWTTNKHLSKKAAKFNDNVHIIPNAVDSKLAQWQKPKLKSKHVRVGYIAGNNHQFDLEAYEIDLGSYESYTVDIEQYPEMTQAKHILSPVHPSQYGELYSHIDVNIVPLIATEFNKCKSNLKLIEAAFTNTAVICSPVSPYIHYLKPNVNCLAPTNANEWREALELLSNDKGLVQRLAAQLKEDMKEFEMGTINKLRLATL